MSARINIRISGFHNAIIGIVIHMPSPFRFIIIIINLFSVDQTNRIHNHSIYVKAIAIIEDKC